VEGSNEHSEVTVASLQARVDELLARQQRLADLLECGSPEQLEHKLRNLLHELQLMRTVFERQPS
jgi:hypothetical protein